MAYTAAAHNVVVLGVIRSLGLIHGGGELPLRGKCGARYPRPRPHHLRKWMPRRALEAPRAPVEPMSALPRDARL